MLRRDFLAAAQARQAPGGVIDGLELWLRDDRGVVVDGGKVSEWQDQSGKGRHFSEISSTLRPLSVNVGGRQRIRFVGADSTGLVGPTLPMSGAAPRTVVAVYHPFVPVGSSGSPGQSGYIFFAGAEGEPGAFSWQTSRAMDADPYFISYGSGSFGFGLPRINVQHLTEVAYDGASLRAAINSGAYVNMAVALDSAPGLPTYVGRRPSSGPTTCFDGYYDELLVWSRVLTADEVAGVRADINVRRAIW